MPSSSRPSTEPVAFAGQIVKTVGPRVAGQGEEERGSRGSLGKDVNAEGDGAGRLVSHGCLWERRETPFALQLEGSLFTHVRLLQLLSAGLVRRSCFSTEGGVTSTNKHRNLMLTIKRTSIRHNFIISC